LYDLLQRERAVLGVADYPSPIEWAFRREPSGVLVPMQLGLFSVRAQDLASAYHDVGQVYFMLSQRILLTDYAGSDGGSLGYPIQRYQAIEIDTIDDWRLAELVYSSIRQNLEQCLCMW
jgi:CMP-N-acetylneuraminic acid synthetase